MTSNIGSEFITGEADSETRNRKVTEALRLHFRPEFLNRIDETIVFDRLQPEDLDAIVAIQVDLLQKQLEKKGVRLALTAAAVKQLAVEGYDPAYGARPLKRVIQRRLLDPLSLEILEGKFTEGDSISVDFADPDFTFTK